jgi:hypothetical protein
MGAVRLSASRPTALERAIVSPLEPLKFDILVSKFAFKCVNLYRYTEVRTLRRDISQYNQLETVEEVGLHTLNYRLTG